jgi:hypothetical protein
MQFPKIPKPLLIFIVIIVILGVVSCGAGVFRGLTEDPQPAPENAGAGLKGVINGPFRAEDINVIGGDCTVSTTPARITIPSSCQLRLEPVALLPRVLKVEINSTSADTDVDVTVSQEIDGKIQSPDTETIPRKPNQVPDFEISAAGSSPVFVTLSCSSCVLDIVN